MRPEDTRSIGEPLGRPFGQRPGREVGQLLGQPLGRRIGPPAAVTEHKFAEPDCQRLEAAEAQVPPDAATVLSEPRLETPEEAVAHRTAAPRLPLTAELDAALRAELREGEEVWYLGLPCPRRVAIVSLFYVPVGLLFAGLFGSFAFVSVQAIFPDIVGPPPNEIEKPWLMLALSAVFTTLGFLITLTPFRAARNARHELHCVTNQRVFRLTPGGGPPLYSWSPDDIVAVSSRPRRSGFGSVILRTKPAIPHLPSRNSVANFEFMPDPRAFEHAVRRLKELHGSPLSG
jgi:hypothetical protein